MALQLGRILLAAALLAAGAPMAIPAVFAQQPQQRPPGGLSLPPRADNPNLRALPAGAGKPVVELQGLDKVTARTQKLVAPVGEKIKFGTLEIEAANCLINTPEAPPEAVAYLTIVDHKPGQAEEKLFAGWMFASAPTLSALDHGVYDVRVLACTRSQASEPPKSR
jgi:hypothetical protein